MLEMGIVGGSTRCSVPIATLSGHHRLRVADLRLHTTGLITIKTANWSEIVHIAERRNIRALTRASTMRANVTRAAHAVSHSRALSNGASNAMEWLKGLQCW